MIKSKKNLLNFQYFTMISIFFFLLTAYAEETEKSAKPVTPKTVTKINKTLSHSMVDCHIHSIDCINVRTKSCKYDLYPEKCIPHIDHTVFKIDPPDVLIIDDNTLLKKPTK